MVRGKPGPPRDLGGIVPDPLLPRVCVIGAGSSGITAIKALCEARVPFDCFEAGPFVGGNWVFQNPNQTSACYSTLEMNTSGPRMSYSDMPMGTDDFPMHWDVRAYFDRYVDHFHLRQRITFETRVEHVERLEDGTFEVTIAAAGDLGEEGRRRYDAVIVANGHHWSPRWPEPPFPGMDDFRGEQMHAHDYRGPEMLEGKRVLVVGGGNSGMDIVSNAADHAEAAHISVRRGIHVIRKRLGGKPVDQTLLPPWLPWAVRQKAFEIIRRRSGDVSEFGMPVPDHKIGHAHPTLSDLFTDRLAAGSITPKPNITELRGNRVLFTDGTEEEIDLIVYCTGYKVEFPFFAEDFISAPDNELPLYRRTFHPTIEGVYFVGFAQPLGALMPIAEAQGVWIAEHLTGRYRLPPQDVLEADIRAEREAVARRFYASKRHTMEIDFDEWLHATEKELKRGADRAERLGYPLPVESRVGAGSKSAA